MAGTSILLLRGIVGMVAGIFAMFWPGLTIAFLVALFGAYAFVDGVTNVVRGFRRSPGQDWSWAVILQGFVGVAIGVLAFTRPSFTALALLMWIAAWAVITGIFEIVAAIRLRKTINREWLLVLSGAFTIAFGAMLFLFPVFGAIGLAWALGAYAAVSGAILVALAIRLRTMRAVA